MNPVESVARQAPVQSTPAALFRIAVLGNPNTGKSTLFNALTGSRQKIGNYPGVTVERKVGRLRAEGPTSPIELIDLPGTYSMAARSLDEQLATEVLLGRVAGEDPVQGLLVVVDASNLERNLYLTTQLLEFGLPVVVALTMIDIAEHRGIEIDGRRLADALNAPVVAVHPVSGKGIDELRARMADLGDMPARVRPPIPYPEPLRRGVEAMQHRLEPHGLRPGFAEAIRLLVDQGGAIERSLSERSGTEAVALVRTIREENADPAQPYILQESVTRYAWIREIVSQTVRRQAVSRGSQGQERLDRVLTHKFWGLLALVIVMGAVFQSIFSAATPAMDLIDRGTGALGTLASGALGDGALGSLVVDGVIGGVGSVVIFLPQILILFFLIALLEESGYLARAAFLMDRIFARVGLSGRSFIPLLSSFACAVPGVMASRVIEDRKTRMATILLAPLMSCSARLPVYTVLIAAVVPSVMVLGLVDTQALAMLAMYLLGITLAWPLGWIFRRTLFRGKSSAFLIELPPYRVPQWNSVLRTVLERGWAFLVRAGTVIFAISIVVWALNYFPHPTEIHDRYDGLRNQTTDASALTELDAREAAEYQHQSFLGKAGKLIEPLVRPLGWDWRIGSAAIASFPAREVVISTLGVIFSVGDSENEDTLRRSIVNARREDGSRLFDLATALSLMVFFALCAQCAATLAVIRREANSWRWPAFVFGYMSVLAYLGALCTYQVTRLLTGVSG
ncbi:MAG: ferrous iron transport protein B [Candidatus Eisenbacteria bacterium]|uniref:Ferrous iron transport protein B n=1 Tax=Eiseniibacteriota bacterium TaxID=2212470 RepID=A0A956RN19_UNCEI|nr:ferrous iron transport protein B [Candidatus Eisenbacteria bacterium]